MCLAIPMRIIKIDGEMAIAEAKGVETMVNTSLVPDLKLNDRVIIHAGFVIERLDAEEADEIEKIWEEYEELLKE
ncbi:MAG: HypC/HybG/HupF family hydrogenase formation chaperone [Spirochaetota bacterium]|nr:HypC/HybG/HupF family hydrogenase formation chaperone [Spirochaetota bacterium]